MGECCLNKIDELIAWRTMVHDTYREAFAGVEGINFLSPNTSRLATSPNYAYCPILFQDLVTREKVYEGLKQYNIFAWRYFYPLLTDFAPYKFSEAIGDLLIPNAKAIADRVLTLPTYYGLGKEDVATIAQCVKNIIGESK